MQARHPLPDAQRALVKNYHFYSETNCGTCVYCCLGWACCSIPFCLLDINQWDIDRDVPLVRADPFAQQLPTAHRCAEEQMARWAHQASARMWVQ